MPVVTITLKEGRGEEFIGKLSDIIHEVMIKEIDCPMEVKYHAVHEVKNTNLIYKDEFRSMKRSDEMIFIQMTLKEGRTAEKKKAMYERLTDELHGKLGVRTEDIFISVTESKAEDWYFGRPV